MDIDLIEPIDYYKSVLKDKFHNSSEEYFNDLVDKSKIDIEENKDTVRKYHEEMKIVEDQNSILKKLSTYKGLSITLLVISIISTAIGLVSYLILFIQDPLRLIMTIVGATLIVVSIILIKNIKKKIDTSNDIKEEHLKNAEELKSIGYRQLSSLNKMYEYGIPNELINRADTIIQMDRMLEPDKFSYLKSNYGFKENFDVDCSTILVQSGSILGNPFVIKKDFVTRMGTKTYSNSIVITWTTTETDSKGQSRVVSHSETLYAQITMPCPKYYYTTSLVYGNEAAPNLIFSRSPQEACGFEDKKLDKFLNGYEKKLDKMVKKDINSGDGSQFTRLSNTKFEALFNALDRDNEVEFRLLFTPLAQQNEIKLLQNKDNIGYGDDFSFFKLKKVNTIISTHSQSFNYSCDPRMFIDFDIENAKKKFLAYNDAYLRNFYFDMAPLLSIPLYQQTKTRDYIYKNDYPSNITSYEHEVLANSFNPNLLKPQDCVTDIINKTSIKKKNNNTDEVIITSYGYRAEKKIHIESKLGGDGRWHNIPIEYYEYFPIESTHSMVAYKQEVTRNKYERLKDLNSDIICNDGILAKLASSFKEETDSLLKVLKELK